MSIIGLMLGFAAGWFIGDIAPKDFPLWAVFVVGALLGMTIGVICSGIGLP